MAFPVVEARNTTSNGSASSHAVNLPAGIASGDLLLVWVLSVNVTHSYPAGWTQLFTTLNTIRVSCAYRVADGSEGATVTVTFSGNSVLRGVSQRISGHDPAQAPQVGASVTATTANPNPPSLTPTGGAKDYLWIAYAGNGSFAVTAAPTNYTNRTPGGGAEIHETAERSFNAASEDPGTFTLSGSAASIANTLAVHPATAVAKLVMMP